MARFPFLIFGYILFASLAAVHGQERREKPIVVIDPGHGGSDTGAIGVNGLEEKSVALGIAMEVIRLNRELYAGKFEVYSTRYTDT
ncbi:MAG: N-acetylmuramoyl-L-alanine amidase, partial [Pricia sp.]